MVSTMPVGIPNNVQLLGLLFLVFNLTGESLGVLVLRVVHVRGLRSLWVFIVSSLAMIGYCIFDLLTGINVSDVGAVGMRVPVL
jgi:hypothetical protein